MSVISSSVPGSPVPVSQDHFEQSQFEEIARSSAGGRKLKPNAIPTLFSFGDPPYPAITSPYILVPMKAEPGTRIFPLQPEAGSDGLTCLQWRRS